LALSAYWGDGLVGAGSDRPTRSEAVVEGWINVQAQQTAKPPAVA
jgi:hypothetical protein